MVPASQPVELSPPPLELESATPDVVTVEDEELAGPEEPVPSTPVDDVEAAEVDPSAVLIADASEKQPEAARDSSSQRRTSEEYRNGEYPGSHRPRGSSTETSGNPALERR